MNRLERSKVAIFGLGGVGSYVLEALARVGIGSFVLIDDDIISVSNINRQIIAIHETIGKDKVLVAKERVRQINPQARVVVYKEFYLKRDEQRFTEGCDYIIDAMDTVSAKIELIMDAKERKIPIISCMGTGNKLDPTQFKVADISETSTCPLCRVMRRELKRRGVEQVKVVYSEEPGRKPLFDVSKEEVSSHKKRQTPGSVSFVPSVAGLIIASEVVKDILIY